MVSLNTVSARLGLTVDAFRIMIATVAAFAIGKASIGYAPVIVSAYMEGLDIGPKPAGFLMSGEYILTALFTLLISSFVHKISLTRAFLIGSACVLTGTILTVFSDTIVMIAAARVVVALGAGITIATSFAAVASTPDPERTFGHVYAWAGVGWAITFPLVSNAAGAYAYKGVFIVLAVLTLLLVIAYRLLPERVVMNKPSLKVGGGSNTMLGFVVVLAVFLYYLPTNAVWAFTSEIGAAAGMTAEQMGPVFSLATICGLLGGFFATWLTTRIGRHIPILVGGTTLIVGTLVLVNASSATQFVIAQLFVSTSIFFTAPYLFGLGAAIDSDGRWTSATSGAYLFGLSLGPGIGGMLVESVGIPAIGTFQLIVGAIALTMGMLIATSIRKLGREQN